MLAPLRFFQEKDLLTKITKFETDLDSAKQVQDSFLPQEIPQVEGLEIYAESRLAHKVGGDFYDIVQHEADGRLTFVIGDVSSKGVAAALLTAMMHKVFRTSLKSVADVTPKSILEYINTDMYPEFTQSGMISTIFVGQYEPATRKLRYANAGQAPVIYRAVNRKAILLRAENPPIGVLADSLGVENEIELHPDDLFIILTDGFSEACSPENQMFGYEALLSFIDGLESEASKPIALKIFDKIGAYSQSQPAQDDKTLIVLRSVDC